MCCASSMLSRGLFDLVIDCMLARDDSKVSNMTFRLDGVFWLQAVGFDNLLEFLQRGLCLIQESLKFLFSWRQIMSLLESFHGAGLGLFMRMCEESKYHIV